MSITRCCFFVTTPAPNSHDLTFTDIDADQPLAQVLQGYEGWHLKIEDCAAFDDTILEMMWSEDQPEDEPFGCAYVDLLCIRGCTNFSITALKKMVKARKVVGLDFPPPHYGMIRQIVVDGIKPVLSDEDEEWFRANVEDFYWVKHEEDGESETESEYDAD
ncbi:hypothetical protein DXG03_007435 [Asterophora parasitica]|uniref:Uncharacterized protein n=1 Tax=Asterophora parasitica TaxID=117018 RepID=A0A9P7G0U6_9AGAR|nr:hypothetical protein DXG03_007435 [Asterophora parasitica]